MTGGLYHSGGIPLHAISIQITGCGYEEARAILDTTEEFGVDRDVMFQVAPDADGLKMVLRGDLTEVEACGVISRLYRARVKREAKP